ncbi:helix-turn-helix domain-containing protein [Desertimonas flava]|uniref:helix-turn-helix domain-containing protein n=1 Tax=Desertimonas flava TaxID=2064846 RepID=UPI000E348BF3|nr:helix-turn-helix transcriptional regulator [Desertimonas flava]
MARSQADTRRIRDELIAQARRGTSPGDVFARASARLARLVPFDAAAWLGTDPGTGLPTSPVRIEGLDAISQSVCAGHWQDELLLDDVNLFRQLGRASVPAASLRATVGVPARSRRYRRFMRSLELDDELRAVLRVDGSPWGTLTLWRRGGSEPFTPEETAIVAELSEPLADSIRRHARPSEALGQRPTSDRPGLLLFDADHEVVSVNDEARMWLAELPVEPGHDTDHGVDVPVWMMITVFRAGAVRHGACDGVARTRVRTRAGRWLTCHASCLRRPDGTIGETALVIEPALPSAIAPIVIEAFDLSEREQQIIGMIARGVGTGQIADELFLSTHTVRDHVKAIFAKTGVSSRGELVAKLYTDFYASAHAPDVVRVDST